VDSRFVQEDDAVEAGRDGKPWEGEVTLFGFVTLTDAEQRAAEHAMSAARGRKLETIINDARGKGE
jgi:hypothetical protein